jgi:hypothetical protein
VGPTCQRTEEERSSKGVLVHIEDAYAYSGVTVGLGIKKHRKWQGIGRQRIIIASFRIGKL